MMKNLVETAIEAGIFKTLIKVIQESGLFDILSKEGPYTIFAPTDEAFSKLPSGTMDNLFQDKEKLTDILTYHVVQDKIMSNDVIKLKKADTINGKQIKIRTDNRVKIDEANIIKTNIECTNGIIHIIDQVLLPNKKLNIL